MIIMRAQLGFGGYLMGVSMLADDWWRVAIFGAGLLLLWAGDRRIDRIEREQS